MARYTIVVGTSEAQEFGLLDDGAALVGTGLDVDIEFRETGLTVAQLAAIAGVSVAWLNQAGGTVSVTGIEGLPIGTYYVRYTLTDSGSDVGYAPNESSSDEWRVVRV